MSRLESATFNFDITIGTDGGELPDDREVEELLAEHLSYDPLDDDGIVSVLATTLNKRYVDGDDVMVSYKDIRESVKLALGYKLRELGYTPSNAAQVAVDILTTMDDAVVNNATE